MHLRYLFSVAKLLKNNPFFPTMIGDGRQTFLIWMNISQLWMTQKDKYTTPDPCWSNIASDLITESIFIFKKSKAKGWGTKERR